MFRARPVLALLLVVAVLAGCSDDGDDAADEAATPTGPEVGTVLPARVGSDVEGRSVRVTVPGAAYDITVGSPREEVTALDDDGVPSTVAAAEDTGFVGVVNVPADPGGEAYALGGIVDDATVADLALVVDGQTIELGTVDDTTDGVWVVVPLRAVDIGVTVTYDGVEQTVRSVRYREPVEGPELLDADPPGLFQTYCTDVGGDADNAPGPERVLGACTVRATEPVPYVAGLGWAPEGEGWVVADVGVNAVVAGYEGADSNYSLVAGAMTVTLDGEGPSDIRGWPSAGSGEPLDEDDGTWEGRLVFSVEPDGYEGELTFSRAFTAEAQDPDDAAAAGAPTEFEGAYEVTMSIA